MSMHEQAEKAKPKIDDDFGYENSPGNVRENIEGTPFNKSYNDFDDNHKKGIFNEQKHSTMITCNPI